MPFIIFLLPTSQRLSHLPSLSLFRFHLQLPRPRRSIIPDMARLSLSERVAAKRAQEVQKGLPMEQNDNQTHHYPWNEDTRKKQQEATKTWPG